MSQKSPNSKNIEKYFKDIITLMPGHVYWKDKDGVFLGCNLEQALDAGLKSPDEIIGKTDYNMPWSIQADYLRKTDEQVLKSGKINTIEELFELPNGTKKLYLSKKLPLYDDDDKISGVLGISFDITDRKKLEEDLKVAKEKAELANEAKTEFLDNMRHDLRTPLTGIIGFADIIANESTEPNIRQHADNLASASKTLLHFLNEILDAINIISDGTATLKCKFDIHDLLDRVHYLFKPKIIEKKLKLVLNIDNALPQYLVGDPNKLNRIILELLSNAINHTDNGEIRIHLELISQKENHAILGLSIEDSGSGIPKEELDNIFLRFKRVIPSYKKQQQGAGLGLAIVKKLIDDLEGEIYCHSKPKQGSYFRCVIPMQIALTQDDSCLSTTDHTPSHLYFDKESAASVFNQQHNTTAKNILIVEDQAIAANVVKAYIEDLGCHVDVAPDGTTAFNLFNANNYHLIFMDIGLPDIDGFDVAKKLRALEWQNDKHTPIIGLTAHVDTENKAKCINYGMDAVHSKPLTREKTQDILKSFIPDVHSEQNKQCYQTLNGEVIRNNQFNNIHCNSENADKLINAFKANIANELIHLKQYKNDNNWKAIYNTVLKILGGVLYCGLPRLEAACSNLEKALRQNDPKLRDCFFTQLVEELDATKEHLSQYHPKLSMIEERF